MADPPPAARIIHPAHPAHALELVAYRSDGHTYRCVQCNYDLHICSPSSGQRQGMQLQNVPAPRRRTSRRKRAWKITKLLGKGTLLALTLDLTQIPDMAVEVVDLFKR